MCSTGGRDTGVVVRPDVFDFKVRIIIVRWRADNKSVIACPRARLREH